MKRVSWHLGRAALVLLPLAALAAQHARQKPPLTLTLQAPKRPLRAGQRLVLRLNTTNTSGRSILVPDSKGLWTLREAIRVRDQQGRPLPLRPPRRGPEGRGFVVHTGSVQGRELSPGESFTDLVNVTDLYDLSRPGKYEIWVAEPLGPNPSDGLVKSNVVTVTVVR
jgi:hypothetical protein